METSSKIIKYLDNIDEYLKPYAKHLIELLTSANAAFAEKNIPIKFDLESALLGLSMGYMVNAALSFEKSSTSEGQLYFNQISALVDTVDELLQNSNRHGLILGPMQIGKTTLSFALQFLGPIMLLLKKQPLYTFHLLTSQISHKDQTLHELKRFLELYGDLKIICLKEKEFSQLTVFLNNFTRGNRFLLNPTLSTYRELFFNPNELKDSLITELVHSRVRGESIKKIAQNCRIAVESGLKPVILLDEPQWGARNTINSQCVLLQIFNAIKEEIHKKIDFIFIGISATPFELTGLSELWKVKMKLSPSYSGFNFFNGEPIDSSIKTKPPHIFDLTSFGRQFNIKHLETIDIKAWSKGEHDNRCIPALRKLIYKIAALPLKNGADRRGICIRAMTNNSETEKLLQELALDRDRIHVISYFGNKNKGMSVKRAIAEYELTNKPYALFVTNKARLGDAFPSEVDYFLDFSKETSTLNALLQGLLGRACGHNKESSVLMSDKNVCTLRRYVDSHGLPIRRPSAGSVAVLKNEGVIRPETQLLLIDFTDSRIRNVAGLKKLGEIINEYFTTNLLRVKATKNLNGAMKKSRIERKLPLIRWLNEFGIYETLKSNLSDLQRGYTGVIDPILPGERIECDRKKWPAGYGIFEVIDGENCAVSMRRSDDMQRSGIFGRGKGAREGEATRNRDYARIEPVIGLTKIDKNGLPSGNHDEPGYWRVDKLGLPLRQKVRQKPTGLEGALTLPSEDCVYDLFMTAEERLIMLKSK